MQTFQFDEENNQENEDEEEETAAREISFLTHDQQQQQQKTNSDLIGRCSINCRSLPFAPFDSNVDLPINLKCNNCQSTFFSFQFLLSHLKIKINSTTNTRKRKIRKQNIVPRPEEIFPEININGPTNTRERKRRKQNILCRPEEFRSEIQINIPRTTDTIKRSRKQNIVCRSEEFHAEIVNNEENSELDYVFSPCSAADAKTEEENDALDIKNELETDEEIKQDDESVFSVKLRKKIKRHKKKRNKNTRSKRIRESFVDCENDISTANENSSAKKNNNNENETLNNFVASPSEKTSKNESSLVCGRSYRSRSSLKTHLLTHTTEFTCEICNGVFRRSGDLKMHKSVHSEKSIKCPDCSRSFRSKSQLQRHSAVHKVIEGKPFKCDFLGCSSAFSYRHSVTAHKKIYHPPSGVLERKFKCDFDGCGFAFLSKTNLQRHLQIHVGEEKFVCPVDGCGAPFLTLSQLKQHGAVHATDFPHLCSACGKSFKTIASLNQHELIHDPNGSKMKKMMRRTLPLKFPCGFPNCSRFFTTGARRSIHQKIHHQDGD